MKTKINALTAALTELRKEQSADPDFAVGAGLIQTGIEKLTGVQSRLANRATELKAEADAAEAQAKAARDQAAKIEADAAAATAAVNS